MKASIVIPVLNEEAAIPEKLAQLQPLRNEGHEVIVVDGGSADSSIQLARQGADIVIQSAKGRATQMNAGAGIANGELLVFLHIDTDLPSGGIGEVVNNIAKNGEYWGRFNVRLSGSHFLFRIIETMMNWRSRITGIATGDQVIFVSRGLFQRTGGFPDIPLMEDIELSSRLKKISKPVCLKDEVITSSRRWESSGICKTIIFMWWLRLSYWLGKDPSQLARQYYQ
ncbi:TIGR04283 family arsenosugar biosynthesis glycosyltransferase [Kaarinaea lacus]